MISICVAALRGSVRYYVKKMVISRLYVLWQGVPLPGRECFRPEDIILQVAEADGEPVEITDMRLRDAVRLIRGPKGTEVRLSVRKPDGKQVVIPIVRDVVQIEETFVKSTVLEIDGGKIGYIMIPSFYRDFEGSRNGGVAKNATDDTRAALLDLKKQGIENLVSRPAG